MATFPLLRTGAVIQYPATRTVKVSTEIIQFVDGSEQRFRNYSTPYHSWMIPLAVLDEGEIQQLRNFIVQTNGGAGTFSFTDPWDAIVYPSCSLQGNDFPDLLSGPFSGGVTLTIRENRT